MADTKVQEVMTHLVVMLYPHETIHEAAQRLTRNGISGAPVVDGGRVIGIVSESDLIHAVMPPTVTRGASILDVIGALGLGTHPHVADKTVADIMSRPVTMVSPSTSVWTAAMLMERKGIKRLPVADEDGYLLGIISRADVVKAMARGDEDLRDEVIEAISILGPETIEEFDVSVFDGIATLTGTADRKSTREIAVKLATRTPGIVKVEDHMDHRVNDAHFRDPRPENDPKDPSLDWHPESAVHRVPR